MKKTTKIILSGANIKRTMTFKMLRQTDTECPSQFSIVTVNRGNKSGQWIVESSKLTKKYLTLKLAQYKNYNESAMIIGK